VAIVRVRWRFHPSNLAGRDLSGQAEVSVTMPSLSTHARRVAKREALFEMER
jgi:hypothetical protein